MKNKQLLTKAEVAKRYGVTGRTVQNWITMASLPCARSFGRPVFRLAELKDWERQHNVAPVKP